MSSGRLIESCSSCLSRVFHHIAFHYLDRNTFFFVWEKRRLNKNIIFLCTICGSVFCFSRIRETSEGLFGYYLKSTALWNKRHSVKIRLLSVSQRMNSSRGSLYIRTTSVRLCLCVNVDPVWQRKMSHLESHLSVRQTPNHRFFV